MAVEAKITLNKQQYVQELEQVKNKTKQATGSMQESARKAGENFSRVGGAASAMGSAVGQQFGAIGQAISALAAGPLAALLALFVVLADAAKKMWNKFTLSAEEAAAATAAQTEGLRQQASMLGKQSQSADKYMARLRELSKVEKLSNAEKFEAETLIKRLTKEYGNLGISIDKTSGKIIGMDRATAQFNLKQAARQKRQKQLELKASVSDSMASIEGLRAVQRGNEGIYEGFIADLAGWIGGGDASWDRQNIGELIKRLQASSPEQILKFVDKAMENEATQSDPEMMKALAEIRKKIYDVQIKKMEYENSKEDLKVAGKTYVESTKKQEQTAEPEKKEEPIEKLNPENAESAMAFTNALTQRGGFATGAKVESLNDINRRIADASARSSKALQEINAKMDNLDKVRL